MTPKMFAYHCYMKEPGDLSGFVDLAVNNLIPMGYDTFIAEIGHNVITKCHPEISGGSVPIEQVKEAAEAIAKAGGQLVPLFNCFGHQGWKCERNGLLQAYPEYDETPEYTEESHPDNFYTPSWCGNKPGIYDIVLPVIDELIEATNCKYFHVGMDEIFEMAHCPACKDIPRHELMAKNVKILHDHLTKRGVRMMMWGDRLIDSKECFGHTWEADIYGSYPAVDMIPKDIIITDWHYETTEFPSVHMFMEKGFDVMPSCFMTNHSVKAMSNMVYGSGAPGEHPLIENEHMLGMCVTNWIGGASNSEIDFMLTKTRPGVSQMGQTIRDVAAWHTAYVDPSKRRRW